MATLFLRSLLHAVLPKVDALAHNHKALLFFGGSRSKIIRIEMKAWKFLIHIFSAAPYFNLMRGSMILYRISTTTFAKMIRVANTMVVPMIMV